MNIAKVSQAERAKRIQVEVVPSRSLSQSKPPLAQATFHLVIDGCNGPIRFREQDLVSDDDVDPKVRNASISMLNCHQATNTRSKRKNHRKSGKKNRSNGKECHDGPLPDSETTHDSMDHPVYPRLNILPLAKLILQDKNSPFDEVTIVFDGVSLNKRPTTSIRNKRPPRLSPSNHNDDDDDDATTQPICDGKLYHVTNRLRVEITGLYDEADNVMMEKVTTRKEQQMLCSQRCSQTMEEDVSAEIFATADAISTQLDRNLALSSTESLYNEGGKEINFGSSVTSDDLSFPAVTVIQRRDQGPGRARSVLQPLGLLRPASSLCLFTAGFGSLALQRDATRTMSKLGQNNSSIVKNLLEPVRHIRWTNESSLEPLPVPVVVVTDDVFLRQRVVGSHAFVMTFHQFWILLAGAQYQVEHGDWQQHGIGKRPTPSLT